MAQAVAQQGQEQVGQIANENVSMHVLSQPMANGPQFKSLSMPTKNTNAFNLVLILFKHYGSRRKQSLSSMT